MTAVGGMATDRSALADSLERTRFELIPMKGVEGQLDHLPPSAVVTVTSSPSRGVDATLELARTVRDRGHPVVPHLAARTLRDRAQVREVLDELAVLDVTDVFVVAGDADEPAGAFPGAHELLAAMADMGHDLDEVGITGYPESHSRIDDATTIQAMYDKAPLATYIVSQICYSTDVTASWVRAVRARGVELPIHIGLPGVVDRKRLLRISMRIGLGDSLRFVSKQSGVAGRLLAGYQPDALVDGLGPLVADPAADVVGWHLFTFNEVEPTVAWWREQLDRADRGPLS